MPDVDPEILGLLRQLRLEQAGHAISAYIFTQQNSPKPMHPQSLARYTQKFSKPLICISYRKFCISYPR